jgi:SNF2 family DNA or RNA helicase
VFKDKLKSVVRGVKWNPDRKCWVAPATISSFKNLVQFDPKAMQPEAMQPDIRAWYNDLKARAKRIDEFQRSIGDPPRIPEDFKLPVPMYKHQLEAFGFTLLIRYSAVWLDLGLGKTYVAITSARFRHRCNGVNLVLVVAPRSILHQWGGDDGQVARYGMGAKCVVLEGTPVKKAELLIAAAHDAHANNELTFCMVTYESLVTMQNVVIDAKPDMFILDESTKIKNPTAKRSLATIAVCKKMRFGIELTGLPYLNNPTDLFTQFQALDTSVYGDNRWSFEDRYIDWVKTSFGRAMRGIKKLDELKKRAYFIAFSRTKGDCMDLPEKLYLPPRKIGMYDDQKQFYEQVSNDVLHEIEVAGNKMPLTNVLTVFTKLQQITSGFMLVNGIPVWFGSPKYDELCDIVSSSKESFIIWARHRFTMKKISDMLYGKEGITSEELNADVSQEKRAAIIKAFKAGALRVVICQLNSESRGLDLTSKKPVNAVYFENTFSIDERWQSESRHHRIGMSGTATYLDLVCEGTIDEAILDVLTNKYKVAEYISTYGLPLMIGKGGYVAVKKVARKQRKPSAEQLAAEEPRNPLAQTIAGLEELA